MYRSQTTRERLAAQLTQAFFSRHPRVPTTALSFSAGQLAAARDVFDVFIDFRELLEAEETSPALVSRPASFCTNQ